MRISTPRTFLTAALATVAIAACDSDGTGPEPPVDDDAEIRGRIVETMETASAANGTTAGAANAETVAVADFAADGSVRTLAEADVGADGSFVVEGVPAQHSDLTVIARSGSGATVGRAIVHGTTQARTTLTAQPVDRPSTLSAAVWTQLHATGRADVTSAAETDLLLRTRGSAAADLVAQGDVAAAADGMAVAAESMTRVYADAGVDLDAEARGELVADAAVQYARARFDGSAASTAHDAFLDATLDAWTRVDADLETTVQATAAAASTLDASVHGRTAARGALVSDAMRLNLRARQRIAANVDSGAEADVALAILSVLQDTEASLRGAATAAEIRTTLDAHASAAGAATVDSMLDVLVPDGSLGLRSDVEARAEAAVEAARLSTRLSGAASANAAADAMVDYRSSVRTAVQAMLEAAGRTDLDVDVMTSLYIAAHGGAHIRAG